MKANVIVKVLAMVVIIAAVLVIGTKGLRAPGDMRSVIASDAVSQSSRIGGEPLDHKTRAALGIEADTPADTVKTLVTEQREQRARMQALQSENAQLRQRNQQLLQMEGGIRTELDRRVDERAREIEQREAQRYESMKEELLAMVQQFKPEPQPPVMALAPTGPPSEPPTEPMAQPEQYPGATIDADGTVWIPPARVAGSGTNSIKSTNTNSGIGGLLNLGKNAADNITGEAG